MYIIRPRFAARRGTPEHESGLHLGVSRQDQGKIQSKILTSKATWNATGIKRSRALKSLVKTTPLVIAALLFLGGCVRTTTGEVPLATSDAPPDWMTCPDEVAEPIRRDSDEDTVRLRQVRPAAGGTQDPDLYAVARYISNMYEMYDVFDEDGDPETAFPSDVLTLNALIYGNPGRSTERGLRARRTRTIYGFWATDKASGEDVIVIRGTLTPREWMKNLQVTQRAFPPDAEGARVHRGFLDIYKSFDLDRGPFEGSFADAIEGGAFAGRTLVVTGHSLGGALATLAATEMARAGETAQTRLVTVASPRVGNGAFREAAGDIDTARRICNLPDLVPMVPFSTRRITYVHVGEPVRYSSFDFEDELDSNLESKGQQVLCWHSIDTYGWMLDNTHKGRSTPECWR